MQSHKGRFFCYDRDYPEADVIFEPAYDNLGRIVTSQSYDYGANPAVDIVNFDYEYEDNTNNIDLMTYNHRSGSPAPANDFGYDNLDRLTAANYDGSIFTGDDGFVMDDLGNRTGDNTICGATVNYAVDTGTNNNQYDTVGGNSLAYDAAGNLTTDENNYDYIYDYENRVIEVKNTYNQTVGQYAYDALGRRIKKVVDSSITTLYYHNYNWQVLLEAVASISTAVDQRYFVYGNYIDEPLLMVNVAANPDEDYYYVHDHLYSPVALLNADGTIAERYEYDAYGKCHVHTAAGNDGIWLTGDDYIDDHSNLNNPYAFTGRTLDVLDGGNYQIMYYRNRYYSPNTGRWLTNDPLGVVPNAPLPNRFGPLWQYRDSMNLYEYVKSNAVNHIDPMGTRIWSIGDRWIVPDYHEIGYLYTYKEYYRNWRDKLTYKKKTVVANGCFDWQYKVLEIHQLNVAGVPYGGGSYDADISPVMSLSNYDWYWPPHEPGPREGNLCRKLIKCRSKCCDTPEPYTVEWIPDAEIRGTVRLRGDGENSIGPVGVSGTCETEEITQERMNSICDKLSADRACMSGAKVDPKQKGKCN